MEKLVLLAIHASKNTLGARAATDIELFGGLGRIMICGFLDPFELLHHARFRQFCTLGSARGTVIDRLWCSYSGMQPETADTDMATPKDLL